MCINIGSFSEGAGAFIITDTRVTWQDGSFEDPGGKIVSTGSGWATGCGKDINVFTASLAALRDSAPRPFRSRGYDESREAYTARVACRANELVRYSLEANQLVDHPKNIVLLIEPDTNVITIQSGKARLCVSNAIAFPSDLEHEEQTRGADFLQDMSLAPGDLASRIHCAAVHFKLTSIASKVMSDTIEVGYILPTPDGPVRGFLRGKADDIVNTKAGEILERFQADCDSRLFREIWDCKAREEAGATLNANGTLLGPFFGSGTTPSISVPTGAGAMGTSPTGTIAGTDTAGFIHTIVGTSPAASGDICTVTFTTPFPVAPFVVISAGSSGGANARAYSINVTTTAFTVTTTAGYGGAGAILDYYYQVIG